MTYANLQLGSTGADVTTLQNALNTYGVSPQLQVTGTFDSATQTAVLQFQTGQFVDGVIDQTDWTALAPWLPVPSFTVPPNKVVRQGSALTMNGAPFRIVGLNMWPMAISSWSHPPNYDGRNVSLLTQYLTDIKVTFPKLNAIRVWFLQQFTSNNGARDFTGFDAALAAADAAGVKIIACLEDGWGYERGQGHTALSASWFNGGYRTTVLPLETQAYRDWVIALVTHYANDPRILMWELVNEGNSMPVSFVKDISVLVDSLDPFTPICCGEVGPLASQIYSIPTVDIASFHYYTDYGQTNWQAVSRAAQAAGKPWMIGEYGIDSTINHHRRANTLHDDMTSMFASGNLAGFLYWQYAETGGDLFNMSIGDPGLAVLSSFGL